MLHIFILLLTLTKLSEGNSKERSFFIDEKQVNTTFAVDHKFIGTYQGRKNGYLKLNADGTGEYLYDIFIPGNNCRKDTIRIEWGFLLDDNHRIIKFERAYGYSYPVLYKSISDVSFQGCSSQMMIDYILEYNVEEFLTVSSSDDWVKEIPYQEIEKEAINNAVKSRFSEE